MSCVTADVQHNSNCRSKRSSRCHCPSPIGGFSSILNAIEKKIKIMCKTLTHKKQNKKKNCRINMTEETLMDLFSPVSVNVHRAVHMHSSAYIYSIAPSWWCNSHVWEWCHHKRKIWTRREDREKMEPRIPTLKDWRGWFAIMWQYVVQTSTSWHKAQGTHS